VFTIVPSQSTVSVWTNSDRKRVHTCMWKRDCDEINGINALTFIATVALATVVMRVRSVLCGKRRRPAQSEHRVAEEADDRLDRRGRQTFDEHLHSIVNEHNLLRRDDWRSSPPAPTGRL
jgi:hypothetical protein